VIYGYLELISQNQLSVMHATDERGYVRILDTFVDTLKFGNSFAELLVCHCVSAVCRARDMVELN